jgi:peptidoglycan/LPS O-acetylase OafA/YrhL
VAVFFTWALTRHFGLEWRETSLDTALINLTMLQDLFNVPHVDGAYWTLVVELRFYLVVGTLYFLGAFRHFAVTLTALLAVSALYTAGLRQYPFLKAWGEFLEFLPLFAAGMTLFKLRVADRAEYPILYALLFGCIGVRALSAAFHVYMILAAIGVFLLLPTGLLRSLGSRPFVYLGTISYSLYLIHQNVGIVAIRELERVDFNPWWAITVTTIAMVAIATIMTYLVERPAARALKRRKPKLAESTPNGTAELQERTARSLVT